MFSGKTSELVHECKKWSVVYKNILLINHSADDRYGSDEFVYTHNLEKMKCVNVSNLSDISLNIVVSSDLILINEAQFFNDLKENVLSWCEIFNKKIILSGLDGDYKRKPFGQLLELIPYANSVKKLSAFCSICNNGNEAYFSHRLSNETDQVVVGSTNYVPLCREHYLSMNKKNDDVLL